LVEAGARPAGIIARDILRVEAGQAVYGEDIDESVYPQEARLENAFSLTKGCFIGQEVVAKIDTYGGLNKRLVGLKISHDDPIVPGTRLLRTEDGEQRDLGVITSWAYSFVLDTGLALGYVKRRHQKPGTRFQVGESGATAEIVPIPVRSGAVPVTGEFE
jgi:folate-binding protein YgfZ